MSLQVTEVQKALKGMDYPADRDDLVQQAERNGADQEIIDALKGMDRDSFDGPNAVMKGLRGNLGGSTDD